MKKRLLRWLKVTAIVVVILVVVGLIAYRPLLTAAGNFLILQDKPERADAIVVLAGGDVGRPLEAMHLYKAGMAPWIVVTTEKVPPVFNLLKQDGIVLNQTYENYVKVIVGYGVPEDHVLRIEKYVSDTHNEMDAIAAFAKSRGWKKLLIVTSNFHTRRAKMTARFVLEPEIHATVVAASQDGFDPATWFNSQGDTRTFVIEAEKLFTYTIYMWPRLVWRGK